MSGAKELRRYSLNTTHQQADVFLQVGRREDNGRILASKLQCNRGEVLRSCLRDLERLVSPVYAAVASQLTMRPMRSEPMNVMCRMNGDLVNASASSG